MELSNFRDVNYEMIEYIITDPDTKRPVHKKINIKFITDLMGNAVNHSVYGSWRRMGFWTDKDFKAEPPVAKLLNDIDVMIHAKNDIGDIKSKIYGTMEKLVKEDETMIELHARLGSSSAYGADHNLIDLPTYVTVNNDKVGGQDPMRLGNGKGKDVI